MGDVPFSNSWVIFDNCMMFILRTMNIQILNNENTIDFPNNASVNYE